MAYLFCFRLFMVKEGIKRVNHLRLCSCKSSSLIRIHGNDFYGPMPSVIKLAKSRFYRGTIRLFWEFLKIFHASLLNLRNGFLPNSLYSDPGKQLVSCCLRRFPRCKYRFHRLHPPIFTGSIFKYLCTANLPSSRDICLLINQPICWFISRHLMSLFHIATWNLLDLFFAFW